MNRIIPIEDNFEDVLSKAMRGLGFSKENLGARSGLSIEDLDTLLSGKYHESSARRVAKALFLDDTSLHTLAIAAIPPVVELPKGIILHNTAFPIPGYEEMTVNSYSVVPNEQFDSGFLIDAGSRFESILTELSRAHPRTSSDWSLFLTHTHPDHVIHYSELSDYVIAAYTHHREPHGDATPLKGGEVFQFGQWQLKTIETAGHSPGGTSYLLHGAKVPVVFVGDALFCYSIGKIGKGYEAALAQIQKHILSLPDESIICPGHGPPTTVEFEKAHNPFFARTSKEPADNR